jgi:hypothetical protein
MAFNVQVGYGCGRFHNFSFDGWEYRHEYRWHLRVSRLYGLNEFRRGTIIAIMVVTILVLCGTWTQIAFGSVLPPTKKGSPSY